MSAFHCSQLFGRGGERLYASDLSCLGARADLRNGRLVDIVHELQTCAVEVVVTDPAAAGEDVKAAFDAEALVAAGNNLWRL